MPLALDLLERDPLAEGDFHPGDLLVALLKVPPVGERPAADRRLPRRAQPLNQLGIVIVWPGFIVAPQSSKGPPKRSAATAGIVFAA
ncbi:contact-dependent growth inhibition system immunity protein [Amycolatopsis sp. cmx-4-83]|uniref:contact-dependent growth inhibition system immunity protein n=1 Tax=Amycolatopsis sp. cmx-4-83 TaxID=2790940 RepID=UPI00397840C5